MHNVFMKKNHNGFAILELVLITAVFVVLGLVGWTVYTKHNESSSSNSISEEVIFAKEGTKIFKMLPGQTIVKLPSGDILRFGNTGTENSVPDFIFGANYVLNDDHNINWLPIKKNLTTYSNGYQYELANKGCLKERKLDIDVEITVVTSCTIEVKTTKKSAPQVSTGSFSKTLSITENQGGGTPVRSILKTDPYLFLGATNMRVTKTVDGTKVYSNSGDWEVVIITNFGIETIKYTAEELYAQQTKSVTIGPAKVDVIIAALTCTPAYSPALGCKNQYATVYDKIDFTVKYSSTSGKQDVKILNYEE